MDRGVTSPLYGNYRAKVVENRDTEMLGRVLLWIPDLMPSVPQNQGIWARPANNPIGGRNLESSKDNYYTGSSFIPKKGSWVFCFFEAGNINRPYYFAGLDLENAKVLPENQLGTNFQDKWTIFKSHDGRAIIISDDDFDERVEITGKKRKLQNPPSGDKDSVYQIDTNQTTILFDEREGKEKILIRTYKGDFFHIDIDSQKLQIEFENDIIIKTKNNLNITAENSINIKSLNNDVNIQADKGQINEKAQAQFNMESGSEVNLKSGGNFIYSAVGSVSGKAGADMFHDGVTLKEQTGAATEASSANNAVAADPKGERDT